MGVKKEILLVLFIALALFSHNSYGFGVAPDYLENDTLLLNKGMMTEYKVTLQNPEDATMLAVININSEVARLKEGKNVTIPPKNYDTKITFEISPPPNAKVGEIYETQYSVEPILIENETSGKGVVFGMRMNHHFYVKIVEKGGVGTKPTLALPIRFDFKKFYEKNKATLEMIISISIKAIVAAFAIAAALLLLKKSSRLAERISMAIQAFASSSHHYPEKRAEEYRGIKHGKIRAKKILRLKNKNKIRDIKELYEAIYTMDEKTFRHHVHKYRNDLSFWIEEQLGDKRLARELSIYLTKDHFIRILAREAAQIEMQKKRKR